MKKWFLKRLSHNGIKPSVELLVDFVNKKQLKPGEVLITETSLDTDCLEFLYYAAEK